MTIDEVMRLAREASNKLATPANWHVLEAALSTLVSETYEKEHMASDEVTAEVLRVSAIARMRLVDELAEKNSEVERLRAEVERLRAALESIKDCCEEDHAVRDYTSRETEIRGLARAALQEPTP